MYTKITLSYVYIISGNNFNIPDVLSGSTKVKVKWAQGSSFTLLECFLVEPVQYGQGQNNKFGVMAPPGFGPKTVSLVFTSVYASIVVETNSVDFDYDPPFVEIAHTETIDQETDPKVQIFIIGTSFGTGTQSVVYVSSNSDEVLNETVPPLDEVYINRANSSHFEIDIVFPLLEKYVSNNNGYLKVKVGTKSSNVYSFQRTSPKFDNLNVDASGNVCPDDNIAGCVWKTAGGNLFSVDVKDAGVGDYNRTIIFGSFGNCLDLVFTPTDANGSGKMSCKSPPGEGKGVQVVIYRNNQPGPPVNINFADPVITGVAVSTAPGACTSLTTPCNVLPTNGGSLTITGTNFGITPQGIFLPNVQLQVVSSTHTTLLLSIPVGSGKNIKFVVNAAGSISNAVTFSYVSPVVFTVSSTKYANKVFPTIGDSTDIVTLTGKNFGNVTRNSDGVITDPVVTIGSQTATLTSASDTLITFYMPGGIGVNVDVIVSSKGQSSSYVEEATVSFLPPVVSSVDPSHAPTTALLANGNKVVVTLTGSQLGFAGLDLAKLFLGGAKPYIVNYLTKDGSPNQDGFVSRIDTVCSLQVTTGCFLSAKNDEVKFVLPESQGSVDLQLVVGGQNSQKIAFKYDPPVVTSVTPNHGPTSGNFDISFAGANFGKPSSTAFTIMIEYGKYSCVVKSQTQSQVICTIPSGVGGDYTVKITQQSLGGWSTAVSSPFPFSYDPPSLTCPGCGFYPNVVDSSGSRVTICGQNLAAIDMDVSVLSIRVNATDDTFYDCIEPELSNFQGSMCGQNTQLNCVLPDMVVGSKGVDLTVANQTVSYYYFNGTSVRI
jgi:hypothetical protein